MRGLPAFERSAEIKPSSCHPLHRRTCYVPQMGAGSTRLFCAALRGAGIDAQPTPISDAQTLELAARYVTDQCYPQKVTLGNFLKIAQTPGFDPRRTAFFMPEATGPCRFGQYARFARRIFDALGAQELLILSPNFDDGYAALGTNGTLAMRYGWWGLVAADLLRRLLLRLRPYEIVAGVTDRVYEEALSKLEDILADPQFQRRHKFNALRDSLTDWCARFQALDHDLSVQRPLIGIVGEIFCRLDDFSNEEIVRRIEARGGEAWQTGLCEWVHYANHWQDVELRAANARWSLGRLRARLSSAVQHRDERLLSLPFADDLADRREPASIGELLRLAHPYLPAAAGLGEMTLSLGRAAYLHQQGVSGVLDISPFSCMNGIVTEALYPQLSRDHDNLPIRTLYFDGSAKGGERELDLFMDLAHRRNHLR